MRSFDTALINPAVVGAGRLAHGRTAPRLALTLGVAAAIAAGFTASAAAQQQLAVAVKRGSVATIYVTPQAMIDSARQTAEDVSDAVNNRLAPGSPPTPNDLVLQYAGDGSRQWLFAPATALHTDPKSPAINKLSIVSTNYHVTHLLL